MLTFKTHQIKGNDRTIQMTKFTNLSNVRNELTGSSIIDKTNSTTVI